VIRAPGSTVATATSRQLAVEPHLCRLRRHHRSLLRRLEQARRSTVENHLHWMRDWARP